MPRSKKTQPQNEIYEVDTIRGIMLPKDADTSFFLVKWKGYNEKDNSWEPKDHVTNCVPAMKECLGSLLYDTFELSGASDMNEFVSEIASDYTQKAKKRAEARRKKIEDENRKAGLPKKKRLEKRKREKMETAPIKNKRHRSEMPSDYLHESVIEEAKRLGATFKTVKAQAIYADIESRQPPSNGTPRLLNAIDAMCFKDPVSNDSRIYQGINPNDNWVDVEIGIQWIDDHDSQWLESTKDSVLIASCDDYGFAVRQVEMHNTTDPVVYVVRFGGTGYHATMALSTFLKNLRPSDPLRKLA